VAEPDPVVDPPAVDPVPGGTVELPEVPVPDEDPIPVPVEDPVPAVEPVPLVPVPGVVEVPELLPIAEPLEPEPGEITEPLPVVEPLLLEPAVLPEPPTEVEPLALVPAPGVIAPELVPVPGVPPPGTVDGVPVLPCVPVPDATSGHLGPPGVVVLPDGGVCCALAVSAHVIAPIVSAAVTNRFILRTTFLHACAWSYSDDLWLQARCPHMCDRGVTHRTALHGIRSAQTEFVRGWRLACSSGPACALPVHERRSAPTELRAKSEEQVQCHATRPAATAQWPCLVALGAGV
jgi:hypothetical protein